MLNSVIESMGKSNIFMKSVAAIVLVTFSMLVLTPTVVAAQTYDWGFLSDPEIGDETKFSRAIQQVEELLEVLEVKLNDLQDTAAEQAALVQARHDIVELDRAVTANFSAISDSIQVKGLPEIIQKRQSDMESNYRVQLNELLTSLQDIESATDAEDLKIKIGKAKGHLKSHKNKRSHQPFDPNELPSRSRKPNRDNKPKESKSEFQAAKLFDNPYTKIASLGEFTFDLLPDADDPAYLSETVEVKLTQAINDKAEELNHDPVKIYHWVRNNIEWQPTWGAVQNAELTLSARRGNAMDISSLLIALLRASGIPARYVHGAIDVPVENFKNWAGGFSSTDAAINYASAAGIPITSIISGGQIIKVRLEHIWVEAAIDYQPSRGAKNYAADSWVAMDPSYKQYEYQEGLDAIAISGIDPEQLAQSFLDSGTVNEDEGWVTGFDPIVLQNAQEQAQQALEQHINDNMTDPTVGDVIGGRKTIIQEYPVLPSALPNATAVIGATYGKLPEQLQQKISFAFGKDVLGDPIDPVTLTWPTINNERVTLSFKPATEDDEQALEALLPEGEITDVSQLPSSIPAYLINVIPQIKLNGEVIKSGTAMGLGEELDLVTAIDFAQRADYPARTYKVISGSYLVLNTIAGNVSPNKLQTLQARLEQTKAILETEDPTQIGNLTREDLLGDMFFAGSLGYYGQYLALSHIAGLQQQGHHYLAAGYGTIGYEPNVSYFFGIPRAIESGGVAFDIPLIHVSEVGDGDAEKRKQFVMQTGMLSSALEHATPEQMFASQDPADPKPDAISAVKALQKASAQGQRIYHLTQENMGQTLGSIHHDTDTIIEIRNALLAGKEVITHTNAVSVPGWSGAGYIILDPDTGVGAYKISGGGNGGFLVALIITIAAFILLFFAFEILLAGGVLALLSLEGILLSVILAIEINGFLSWIDDLYASQTPDDFNKANAAQALVGMMGILGTISSGIAALVYAFGEAMGFLLTQ